MIIDGERKKMIKSHSVIVDVLTSRTKTQLRRFIGKSLSSEDIGQLGGGAYGRFLSLLFAGRQLIDYELITFATKGIGCDQDVLVATLCTLTGQDIKKLCSHFEKSDKESLSQKIAGKTKKRSAFQHFMLQIARGTRNDSDSVDIDDVESHANIIYDSTLKTVDDVIDILCDASRAHCCAINAYCIDKFNSSLEDIIRSKLSGSIAKALITWTLPLTHAQVYALKENAKNTTAVALIVAGYTKRQLKRMDEISQKLYQKSLQSHLDGSVSGKLGVAMKGWMEKNTPDEGYEEELDEYVADKLREGVALVDLLNHSDGYEVVKDLLKRQRDAMKRANLIDLSIVTPRPDPPEIVVNEFPPSSPRVALSHRTRTLDTFEQENSPTKMEAVQKSFDESRSVCLRYICYLLNGFKLDELERLSATEFWEFFDMIDYADMGYTAEELDGMRSWVEWDVDGYVCVPEVQNELIDMILNGLYNLGKDVIPYISQKMPPSNKEESFTSVKKAKRLSLRSKAEAVSSEALPPDLYQYMLDTFDAYDINRSGVLDEVQFTELLMTLNLGFTEADVRDIKQHWDANRDGAIGWDEAIPRFIEILNNLINDERDHWVGSDCLNFTYYHHVSRSVLSTAVRMPSSGTIFVMARVSG